MRAIPVRQIILMLGAIALWAMATPAWAEEQRLCPICSKANNPSATYQEEAGNRLARGVLNMTLGWTELIRQPAKKARKDGNVFAGMATGMGHSVVRTVRGLGEVLTFWTPKNKTGYIHFSDDCPLDTMQ